MKKFVRFILIGVCILSGYGLVEASSQVDTIDVCYRPKENIKAEIVKDTFDAFREKDSSSIVEKDPIGKTPRYEVEYRDYQLEFKWDSITQCTVTDFNSVIGSATSDYREQIIYCTITYIREIRFKNALIDGTYYDSEKAIQKDDLLGDSTHEYPQLSLTSKRKWPVVIRIKKNVNLPNEEFSIEYKDTCLKDKLILKVPDQYADMQCRWSCDNTYIDMSNEVAPEITISKKDKTFLTTNVQCTIYGCNNAGTRPSSIRIRSYYTPESTIRVDIPGGDCVSNSAFFAPRTIPVMVSNLVEGVTFEWDPVELPVEYNMRKSDNGNSDTFNYPVVVRDDFTIGVTTSGGCRPSHTSKIVHRKLANDIVLQVSDSCLTAGIPFTVSTVPPLPKMDLEWPSLSGFEKKRTPYNDRKDTVSYTYTGTYSQSVPITLKDKVCGGSTSTTIEVSKSYTAMTAKDENNNTINNGDTIAAGVKEITFIAPKHSSITGDEPYSWEVWIYRNPMSSMSPSKGPAEKTIAVPTGARRIFVRVFYTSCRGVGSEEYDVYFR